MNFGRVDHTAIVVSDMDEAVARWSALTGAELTERRIVRHQGVEVAFLALDGTTIELVRPLSTNSGVGRYLSKRGESLHHIGFQVHDISETIVGLLGEGVEMIDEQSREGIHGRIAFIHPRSTGGVLVELVEPEA